MRSRSRRSFWSRASFTMRYTSIRSARTTPSCALSSPSTYPACWTAAASSASSMAWAPTAGSATMRIPGSSRYTSVTPAWTLSGGSWMSTCRACRRRARENGRASEDGIGPWTVCRNPPFLSHNYIMRCSIEVNPRHRIPASHLHFHEISGNIARQAYVT